MQEGKHDNARVWEECPLERALHGAGKCIKTCTK